MVADIRRVMTGSAGTGNVCDAEVIIQSTDANDVDGFRIEQLLAPGNCGPGCAERIVAILVRPGLKQIEHGRSKGCPERVTAERIVDSDKERLTSQVDRTTPGAAGVQ